MKNELTSLFITVDKYRFCISVIGYINVQIIAIGYKKSISVDHYLTHNTNKDRSTFLSTAGGQQCVQSNSSLGQTWTLTQALTHSLLPTKAHGLAGGKPPRLPLGLAFSATIRRPFSWRPPAVQRDSLCAAPLHSVNYIYQPAQQRSMTS